MLALMVSFERQLSELAVDPCLAALFSDLVMMRGFWSASKRAMLPSVISRLGRPRSNGQPAKQGSSHAHMIGALATACGLTATVVL